MKFFIFIAFIALVHADFNRRFIQRQHRAECASEFKISNEKEISNLELGDIAEADTTENQRCYINCLMEKSGIIKDGKFQENATIEPGSMYSFLDDEYKETCRGISGADKCETALKLTICFRQKQLQIISEVFSGFDKLIKKS